MSTVDRKPRLIDKRGGPYWHLYTHDKQGKDMRWDIPTKFGDRRRTDMPTLRLVHNSNKDALVIFGRQANHFNFNAHADKSELQSERGIVHFLAQR